METTIENKLSEVQNKLRTFNVITQKKKNVFLAKRSYFYRTVKLADLIAKVKEVYPDAIISNSGDHFRPFVGGAKSGGPKDSYLWVEFEIKS